MATRSEHTSGYLFKDVGISLSIIRMLEKSLIIFTYLHHMGTGQVGVDIGIASA